MPPTIDTPSTNPDELPEHVDEEPAVDPVTGKKILRPRNAWILFRNEMLDQVPRLPDGSRQPMADASKIISAWWKKASPEVKYRYELQAEQEKEEHKRKYPNYRFQPKSKMQKAKEKAAKRDAAKKAQLQSKKARTRPATSPLPYATSNATSYLAAALANQASQTAATTSFMSTYGREGPSPPLSLASTPTTTPSPFPVSDFEQGSSTSTSATSAHAMPSPSDALGLGLPSPLNFSGQDEANARMPPRVPARLPPRLRVPKIRTDTSLSVPSTSIGAALAQTPATGTPSALSPLPWPLPDDDARQPTPQSREPTPPSAVTASSDLSPGHWDIANAYNPLSTSSDTLSGDLNLTIPDSYSDDFFSNITYGISALPDNEGIFSLAMDTFAGQQLPDQFDVSLTAPMPAVTPELSQSFSEFLNNFDFSAHSDDPQQDPSSSRADHVPESVAEPDVWQHWMAQPSDVHQNEPQSPSMLNTNHDLSPYDQMDLEHPIAQEPTPPAEYIPDSHDGDMQAQEPPPAQQQQDVPQQPAEQQGLPPHLASDPLFLQYYAQYLAQRQQQQNVQQDVHAETQPQYSAYASQVQYHDDVYILDESRHTSSSDLPPPLSPPSSTVGDVHHGSTYVPPSGAATTIGLRRVGGTWKPPIASPSSEGSTSRVPSWGSAVST